MGRRNGRLDRLRPKQKLFVLEYAISGKGQEAAIKAGYAESCAKVTASRMLANPAIRDCLEQLQRKDVRKLELDRLMVLKRLIEALNWEARDLVDEHGILLLPHQLPNHVQKQVDGFEQEITEREDRDGTIVRTIKMKYRMTPHAPARDQAMRHKGMFPREISEGLSDVGRQLREFLEGLARPPALDVDSVESRLEREQLMLERKDEG